MALAGSLEIWPIAHTYGFDVVCADSVTRGEEFDFSVVCMDRTTNRVFGEYAPESPCLIVTDDPLDTFSEPAILPEVWDAGLAALAGTITGGTGANQIVITVTDPETGYTGSKTVNVAAAATPEYQKSLELTMPLGVMRGETFEIKIEGWNATDNQPDTSYVPETTITLFVQDGADDLSVVEVDNTGWEAGVKYVSATLTGGTVDEIATILAQDDSSDQFGTEDINVTGALPGNVAVSFSGYIEANDTTDGKHRLNGGTYGVPKTGASEYYSSGLGTPNGGYIQVRAVTGGWLCTLSIIDEVWPPANRALTVLWFCATRTGRYVFQSRAGFESSPEESKDIDAVSHVFVR
jgi:hypothetical protein